MSQEINDKFEKFETDKEKLLNLFEQTQQIVQTYENKQSSQPIMNDTTLNAIERLRNASFKILVVGEFKRGKSTFINALLGEDILPAYVTPCTAVINEVKYAAEEKAVLHFYNPLPKELPKLTDEVIQHIKKNKSGKIPEMIINANQLKDHALEKYVVIDDPGSSRTDRESPQSPFELVELYWPLEMCKNNVEIIDSPGLNENKTRSRVTENYYSKVDAVIFVTSCDMLASESEMNTIDALHSRGFEDMFFICNRYDQVRERERDRLKQYAIAKLIDKTNLKECGIHFVSSFKALQAMTEIRDENERNNQFEEAGFKKLQNDLFNFLTNNRAKIKILDPSNQLKLLLKELLEKILPQRKKMYEQKYDDLKKRFDSCQPDIELAKQLHQNIVSNIIQDQNALVRNVKSSFKKYMDNQIKTIVNHLKNSQSVDECKEYQKRINSNIEKGLQQWRKYELRSLFHDFIDNISQKNEDNLKEFYDKLDSITTHLGVNSNTSTDNSSFFEKTLKTSGVVKELNAMLKELFYSIGNLADIDIDINSTIFEKIKEFIEYLFGKNDTIKKKFNEIASQIKEQLEDNASDQTNVLAKGVKAKTDDLINQIQYGLAVDLNLLQENVYTALENMRKGKENMEKQRVKIDSDMETLKKLEKELSSMTKKWEKK